MKWSNSVSTCRLKIVTFMIIASILLIRLQAHNLVFAHIKKNIETIITRLTSVVNFLTVFAMDVKSVNKIMMKHLTRL